MKKGVRIYLAQYHSESLGPILMPDSVQLAEQFRVAEYNGFAQGRIQRGDRGSGPPLKNHNNIGFISNTGPDPLKNHKGTKPAFNVGQSSARQ